MYKYITVRGPWEPYDNFVFTIQLLWQMHWHDILENIYIGYKMFCIFQSPNIVHFLCIYIGKLGIYNILHSTAIRRNIG